MIGYLILTGTPQPLGALGPTDVIAALALLVSFAAAALAYCFGRQQTLTARQANQIPALIDLFREHRSESLANARDFVGSAQLWKCDLSEGLAGLPQEMRVPVRELMWFYDNLGALVAHGIVDLEPVAGYLGGSVLVCWTRLEPLVDAERDRRRRFPDPGRWQDYFENLNRLVDEYGPQRARGELDLWRLSAR